MTPYRYKLQTRCLETMAELTKRTMEELSLSRDDALQNTLQFILEVNGYTTQIQKKEETYEET